MILDLDVMELAVTSLHETVDGRVECARLFTLTGAREGDLNALIAVPWPAMLFSQDGQLDTVLEQLAAKFSGYLAAGIPTALGDLVDQLALDALAGLAVANPYRLAGEEPAAGLIVMTVDCAGRLFMTNSSRDRQEGLIVVFANDGEQKAEDLEPDSLGGLGLLRVAYYLLRMLRAMLRGAPSDAGNHDALQRLAASLEACGVPVSES